MELQNQMKNQKVFDTVCGVRRLSRSHAQCLCFDLTSSCLSVRRQIQKLGCSKSDSNGARSQKQVADPNCDLRFRLAKKT